jgi:hypothetical protein
MVERKSKGQTEVLGEKDKLQCHFLNRKPHQENWHRIRAYEWLATKCPAQQRIASGSEGDVLVLTSLLRILSPLMTCGEDFKS